MAPAPKSPRRGKRYGGKNWSELSPSYRKRLQGAGITRASYYAGVDLRAARGKRQKPPPGAADPRLTETVITGDATMDEVVRLQNWAEGLTVPAWIPPTMSPDAKAALSQIDLRPSQWGHVSFSPQADDMPWEMRITPKGAPTGSDGRSPYDRVVLIPGGGGRDTWGAREILDWLAYGDDLPRSLDFDVEGTV